MFNNYHGPRTKTKIIDVWGGIEFLHDCQIWISSRKGLNTEQINKILAGRMKAKKKQKNKKDSERKTKKKRYNKWNIKIR